MSNLKYRIRFQVTNLDKEELRDFNLNLIQSNQVLEFDSDIMPRIPSKSEVIKIADRSFKMTENYEVQYIIEDDQVYNVFNIFIFDFKKEEENNQHILNNMKIYSEYLSKKDMK